MHQADFTGDRFHRILLTGAAGNLGEVLRGLLKPFCSVLRISDCEPLGTPGPQEEIMLADLADFDAVNAIVEGVDIIVHMGGISREAPFAPILQANILGTYNLYEAARRNGVRRIAFASSNHVTGFYSQGETIDASARPRPDGLYGLSKAFGENLAQLYFDKYGIETASMRIGASRPEPVDRRMLATWLSHADLSRLVCACLTAPVLNHTIVYGVSNNAVTWWDNRLASHLGFVPRDSSDEFRQEMYAQTSPPDLSRASDRLQGGTFVD